MFIQQSYHFFKQESGKKSILKLCFFHHIMIITVNYFSLSFGLDFSKVLTNFTR